MPCRRLSLLLRLGPRQPETLISQVPRDGEPYPADPNWHDCAFNGDLPSAEETNGVKQSYQKEEHSCDEGKGPLRHFNLRRTCGQTSRPGRLLSRLLPYQPVHCFLPCVKPGEFASGEGLQRLVEDVGQTLCTYDRRPLYVWPVEDG